MQFKVQAARAAALICLIGAVMSSGQSAGGMPASGTQDLSQRPSSTDGSARRHYVFARGDGISVEAPVGWQDNHWDGQPFPAISFFQPPAIQDFQVLLSPMWQKGRPGPSYNLLRRLVEEMPEKVRAGASESEFPLQPLESRTVVGFYYSASARNPQLGRYRFMTQGAFKAGPFLVAFTILTGDDQEQVVKQALALIGSTKYEIPTVAEPRDQPGTKSAPIELEWSLPVDLPGFEGDPEARNRTAPFLPASPAEEESLPDALPVPLDEPEAVNPNSPFPVAFELEKRGHVLRIRWVHKEHGRTQAIAVAFQLVKVSRKKRRFDLDLFIDGKLEGKKSFKAGQPIVLKARGVPQPYRVHVTEVGKSSISGEIEPSSPVGRVEFDFYTADGRLTGESPQLLWVVQPAASETAAISAQDGAPTGKDVHSAAEGVKNPMLLEKTPIGYTDAALQCKIQGIILLRIVVRQDGSIDQMRVHKSSGYWGLDEVAIEEIANNWRFRPGTLDGMPISIPATVEVIFTMAGSVESQRRPPGWVRFP